MPRTKSNKPKELPRVTQSDIERFWKYVDKTPGQGPEGECWGWIGAKTPRGYGVMEFSTPESVRATRVAYFIQHGADPFPDLLLHHCDWPPCVRGTHIFTGDNKRNSDDAITRGQFPSGDRNGSRLHPERLPRGSEHHNTDLIEEQVVEMRELYAAGGISTRALAKKYGMDRSTVENIVTGKTWKHAGGPIQTGSLIKRGSQTSNTHLVDQDIRDILEKRASGRTIQSLADEYGLTIMPMSSIIHRKTWKHVK